MTEHSFPELLAALVALLVATKLLGAVAQRFGQPAVVGELVAGILLGASLLGVIDHGDPVLHSFAELGVLILLFEIGLHTDLRSLVNVKGEASTVALIGVLLPFGLGYAAAVALGLATIPAVVCGAALTATSIGISARTLSDLGRLDTAEGQIVLGAAVIDDIIGLVILSVVGGLVGGAALSIAGVATTTAVAIGFVIAALVLGRILVPPLFRAIGRIEASGTLGVAGLAFAFLLAWLADMAGSATIIGAFSAGLVLHNTPQRAAIEKATTQLGHFFVPIFFATVGAAVDLRTLADSRAIVIGLALIAVGVIGKVAAGYAPFWFKGDKALIGVAMVPRGEVGLIFASTGLASGALTSQLYSAVAMMVLATTLMTPPILARMIKKGEPQPAGGIDRRGDGGIDDLVAGAAGNR